MMLVYTLVACMYCCGESIEYDELDVFWEWIVKDLHKFLRQLHIFAQGRIFLILSGSGSVFAPEMHSTCSQLHVGSGFLKKD